MRLVYFAWVRERVGTAEEEVSPPDGVTTVADLVDWLAGQSSGHAEAFADPARLRAAIDQSFVRSTRRLPAHARSRSSRR